MKKAIIAMLVIIIGTCAAGCFLTNRKPEKTIESAPSVTDTVKEETQPAAPKPKEPEATPTPETTEEITPAPTRNPEGVAEIYNLTKSTEGAEKYESLLNSSRQESMQYKAAQIDDLLAKLQGSDNTYIPEIDTYSVSDVETWNDRPVYTLRKSDDYDKIVIYIHGGSFITNVTPTQLHYVDNIAQDTNAKVYVPIYPLAPTYTYKDTYALLETLYTSLLEQGKSITIFGDSAGGGIALGFVEELNEKGIQVPDKLILMSPLLDITGTNEEAYENEAKDPLVTRYEVIMCGLAWAGDTDVFDYHVSPIYGDITNMPKTLVTMGSNEYLAKDIMKFYGIMRDNKQDIKLLYGDGLFHVFPFYPMPESDEANGIIAAFIRD